MAIMGWFNTAMAVRYQHIIAVIRRDVATQVGGLPWEPTRESSQTLAPTMAKKRTAVAQQSRL